MRAGNLDRYITIQSPTDTEDSSNVPKVTYADEAVVSAQKIPASNIERYRDQQTVLVDDLIFRIYYYEGLTSKHQILFDDVAYGIRGIKEIGRKEGMEILAREVT